MMDEGGENGPGSAVKPKVGQEQIHGLLFGETLSWQAIIYDLINTEQLDPWDIDLSLLANRFLERVRALEEANFFVSSKVLLAAALLLRIKSEILLDRDLASLDDILFGKKEEKSYSQQRIELDEEIPELSLRTPLPRFRKVSLKEIMEALGKAISTETRRIKRITLVKQYEAEIAVALPKHRINLHDKIKEIYARLKETFKNKSEKIAFSDFAGKTNEDRITTFIPLLHLDNQNKVWLEQEGHFEEIWILLKEIYEMQNAEELEALRKEALEALQNMPKDEEREEKLENEHENPIGDASGNS